MPRNQGSRYRDRRHAGQALGWRLVEAGVLERLGVSSAEVEAVARSEAQVLAQRERAYRDDRPPVTVRGATVILVDDGLATGVSMRAALGALRARGPAAVIV